MTELIRAFLNNFCQNLSFTNFVFFCALSLLFVVYYCVPKHGQWIVLLFASVLFYSTWGIKQFLFVVISALTAFVAALLIERQNNNSRRFSKMILILADAVIVSMLIYVKVFRLFFSGKSIVVPLGISYYTFSIIGYLADVYWNKDKAEKNFLHFLLYMLYFPHIIQGPIPRHTRLACQFKEEHKFDYKQFTFGLQRIVLGLFKKLVVADRFSVLVNNVFGDKISNYSGQTYLFSSICAVFVVYYDFSGCMDIALGISQSLGIKLDENFRRPFYSKTAGEFWRRWHITLGTWFTDYIFMPAMSPRFVKFCGKTKKIFGKRFSRSIMLALPLGLVWLLTGLWHGTGVNYLLWGAYWWLLISFENIFEPDFKKLHKRFGINTSSSWYQRFQMFRTFLLFVFAHLISGLGNIHNTAHVIKSMFTVWNPWIWFDKTLLSLGLDTPNLWVGVLSVLVLFKISSLQEKGVHIRERIAAFPLPVRWALYLTSVFSVLIFGWYGPGFDSSNFIYMKF